MNDNHSENTPGKTANEVPQEAIENRNDAFIAEAKLSSSLDQKVIALAEKMLELSCLEAEKSLAEQTGWLKEKCKAMQKEAMAKGINEGIKEGIKEGLKVGRTEGAKESEQETLSLMAERMLMHGFRPCSAASITGLPMAQIMRIASSLKDKIN